MTHYNVTFPPRISQGAKLGQSRRTQVVVLGSGDEERNSQWANSRRVYEAGYGVRTVNDLAEVAAFWEGARGKLHTFLFKDWSDYKSCLPAKEIDPAADDQSLGTGDGTTATFQLVKVYGSSLQSWTRVITHPVSGTVLVAVDGIAQTETTDYVVDYSTGIITFQSGHIPGDGLLVTAGYEFRVKVRFDTDSLDVVLQTTDLGNIPSIPLIEVRP